MPVVAESIGGPMGQAEPPPQGPPPPMSNMSVSLSQLVELTIHKAHHELTVLAEILNGKDDTYKKLEIIKFVKRTRRAFIRLIALVKWAQSVNKINKCTEILDFLDHQSSFFTETADRLYNLAHDFLCQARLPAFAVPTAIDVLTTGTYPDLPRAIKDRYVPPEPLSAVEKERTLTRLNQVIKCRLVSCNLPDRITDFRVKKGIVSFEVPNEFKVDLTIRGEGREIPWTLLKLSILVEDSTCHDERNLVHHDHLQFLHELCQSRLYNHEKPICDLYSCLHSFCISLQLEVLVTQIQKLHDQRWRQYLTVDKYEEGVKLVLAYWKDDTNASTITVQVNQSDPWESLQVLHNPPLPSCSIKEVLRASKIEHLNIEKLLMDTIQCRTRSRLEKLNYELRKQVAVPVSPEVTEDGNRLIVPLLVPGDISERLDISIDPQTGEILPLLPGASEQQLDRLMESFQDRPNELSNIINDLRFTLAKERCRRAASAHLACTVQKLKLNAESQALLDSLSNYQLFKLSRYLSYYLVVELFDDLACTGKINRQYHLLTVLPINDKRDQFEISCFITLNANPLDQFSEFQIGVKRAADLAEEEWLDADAELCHVISVCDARIPFIALDEALKKEEVAHSGIELESDGASLAIKLLQFPVISEGSALASESLEKQFLSLTFRLSTVKDSRMDRIGTRPNHMYWMVEIVVCSKPEIQQLLQENGQASRSGNDKIERITFAYESEPNESFEKINVLAEFQKDWACVLQLYQLLLELVNDAHQELYGKWKLLEFTYTKIVISYGDMYHHGFNSSSKQPQFSSIVVITWSPSDGAQIKFGEIGGASAANPHQMALMQFTNSLNQTKSLSDTLLQVVRSFKLCRALGRLPITCSVGSAQDPTIQLPRNHFPARQNFSIICESPCNYRLIFRGYYVIDLLLDKGDMIFVRDGSHSKFSNTTILEGWRPISGLLTFLRMGTQMNLADTIGDPFVQLDNPLSTTLPEGHIWAGSEGASFSIEVIKHVLKPVPLPLWSQAERTAREPFRITISPIEQFLSSSYILDFMGKHIRHEMNVQAGRNPQQSIQLIPTPELNILRFATQYPNLPIQYEITLNPANYKNLKLQCRTNDMPMGHPFITPNEFQILSVYFDRKVASPPYRPNATKAFLTLLNQTPMLLKSCIQLMSQELQPSIELPRSWNVTLCLTVPPNYINIVPVGHQAVMTPPASPQRPTTFTLFFIQFTSMASHHEITVPISYDHSTSRTDLYRKPPIQEQMSHDAQAYHQHYQRIQQILQRFNQMSAQMIQSQQCTFYPAINDIMRNLQVPQ